MILDREADDMARREIVYHECQMRRCLSIFLILTFALGPLSALADGSEDANLPACCRRNGAHHCSLAAHMAAMRAMAQQDGTPFFAAQTVCRYYPAAATAFSTPPPALAVSAARGPVLSAHLRSVPGASSVPKSNPSRTHAGRGPPANSLS
jgi:hypothetical protein